MKTITLVMAVALLPGIAPAQDAKLDPTQDRHLMIALNVIRELYLETTHSADAHLIRIWTEPFAIDAPPSRLWVSLLTRARRVGENPNEVLRVLLRFKGARVVHLSAEGVFLRAFPAGSEAKKHLRSIAIACIEKYTGWAYMNQPGISTTHLEFHATDPPFTQSAELDPGAALVVAWGVP